MSDSSADVLAKALSDRYRLERELGRGGMATVYLANDLRHDRRVALKVLHAELAATLGPERFQREIRTTARLQHPHILPVLDSGEAAGLLWYTMPYVRGESLRDRLQREIQLPLDLATELAHQVALALDYAHREGVIHRDLKPENILLSEGQALVADFGVAKALSATDEGSLTETGLAVGTPAYMAPEQASGGQVDGRCDVYALGCVLYEMLAGEPPYSGPTAQAVLAKRFTDPIPSVRRLRDEIPETIDRAIRTALAKTPADRFRTAAQFGSALALPSNALTAPGPATRPERRRTILRISLAGAALAIVLLGFIASSRLRHPAPVTDDHVVMVLPFRVGGADARLAYLREGMVDLLAAKLTGDGGPRSIDPRTVLSAWRRAGGSLQDDVSREEAISIARRLGAGRLIEGSVVGGPEHLTFTASLVQTSGKRDVPSATLDGPLNSLSTLVDGLAARLLAGEAGEREKLANLTSTSLPALRSYLDGRAAYRRGQYRDAVQQFGRALELDSTFALAGIGLRSAAVWSDDDYRPALARAWANQQRLSTRDRLFLIAAAGPRYPAPSSLAERLHAWERVVAVAPDQPEAQYELADHLFHWGPALDLEEPQARAGRAFARAIELDSTFASPLEHLVELAAMAHDTARVRSLSRLYLSRNPEADDAVYVRWRVAGVVGDTGERKALRLLFSRQDVHQLANLVQIAHYDGIAVEDARFAVEAAWGRAVTDDERSIALASGIAAALNEGRPAAADSTARAARIYDTPEAPNWSLHMRILSALYWQGDSGSASAAASLLDDAKRTPGKQSSGSQPWHLVDRCMAQLWRSKVHGAKDIEATVRRVWAGSGSADLAYREKVCAALLDLNSARGDEREAEMRKFERLDSLILERGEGGLLVGALTHGADLELARWWLTQGDFARALRAVRRRAYWAGDIALLSTTLREEARIAALAGDRAGAIRAYQHYLALRFEPEPSQRADVEQARSDLASLVGETPR